MQIHDNILIAECSFYDFKEKLERKKVKSWLKSISAFANTDGGSLFYGVNNNGEIVGLENPQSDAEFISETIKTRLDPVPEIQLTPIEHGGRSLIEVKVKAGILTPYYYFQDGTRTAFIRIGNESVECNSQQLLSLVLKGSHMTWDSLPAQVDSSKHSFIMLSNVFQEQTRQDWDDKYLVSFGLITPEGKLTNAGMLFEDNCTVFQSRLFCTRWTGLYKDNAISSIEHRANLILLLKYGLDFIKNYTMNGWVKMPDGTQIQDRDIYSIPSIRRNPVIADVFTQLDYMEQRGSGLRKMRELTEKLPNFTIGKEPHYKTAGGSFFTTFYNLNWGEQGRIPVEDVAQRINQNAEKFGVSTEKFGVSAEKFGVSAEKHYGKISRTGQRIIDIVISDPSVTAESMSDKIGISKRAIEKNIKVLRDRGILIHEGSDKSGYWRIISNP